MKLLFKASLSLLFCLVPFIPLAYAQADEELGNRAYVTASPHGQFYAKSIPYEPYGLKGVTKVYRVGKKRDTLVQTYDWYSPQIFLAGIGGTRDVFVVQLRPWHRGQEASSEDHAIALYKNEQRLRRYSTLEIAGKLDHVARTRSHYRVFSKVLGFRRPFGNQMIFDAEIHDGTLLSFDAETGAVLSKAEEAIKQQVYEGQLQIARIKRKWFEENKEEIPAIEMMEITEKLLGEFAPEDYPDLPKGYRYVPDTVWKPVRIEKLTEAQ